jgi:hypothetical protein
VLAARGERDAAVRELEAGGARQTGGAGGDGDAGPAGVGRMLSLLATLYQEAGRVAPANAAARQALRSLEIAR